METRTIEQTKIYYLILNPVTDRAESTRVVAASPYLHKLVGWYNEKRCEPYRDDDGYLKDFRKGSLLEYFNAVSSLIPNEVDSFGCGIRAEWENSDDVQHMMNNELPVPFLR